MVSRSNRNVGVAIIVVIVAIIAGAIIASAVNNHKATIKLTPAKSTTNTSSAAAGSVTPNTSPSQGTVTVAQPQTATTTSTTSTPQPTPSCYTAAQAASEEGQSGCVQFTGYAYTSDSGQMYLDQYTSAPYGFSVWIPAGTSGGSSIMNEYSGQSIDVTGSIVNYNGEPEIEVTSASQITQAN